MAIDPIQFQGFTERQGFDPIKVPDPNPFLGENLNVINASLENLKRGNLTNMKAKADAYSRDLAQLADFSQTLTSFLGDAAEIYDKKQEAAANALYYDDIEQHEQDILVLSEGERVLQDGDNVTSKAAVAANRNGAPYSVTKRIAELGGLKGHYYRVKATEGLAAKYDDYIDEARRTDEREISYGPNNEFKVKINETEPTETEEAVIRATLREEYLEQFSGISRGMLAKYAFPIMRQVDQSRASANSDRIALSDSERTRFEALEEFQRTAGSDNPGALQKLVDTYSRTVFQNRNGKVVSLQYGGAWKQLQTDLLELAKAGQFVDLEGLVGDSVNPDTGKKYMDDPVFSTKIKGIQVEISKSQTEAFNDSQRNGLIQLAQLEQEAVALLPESPTEADYIAVEKNLIEASNNLGVTMSFKLLDQHRTNFGQTASQVKAKMAMYELLENAGELQVSDILSEPPEIRKRFLKSAEQQEVLQTQVGGYKSSIKELEGLIKGNNLLRVSPTIGAVGENVNLMYDFVVGKYKQRVKDLVGTQEYSDNPIGASYAALDEIRKEIKAGLRDPNSIYFVNEDGYPNFFRNEAIFNPNKVVAANRRIIDINAEVQDKGKALLESPEILERLVGKDAFARAEENWGKPNYRMDPGLQYLAEKLDLTPFNVIHRGRSTFGMTELPAMVELAALSQNANPDLQRGLNRLFSGVISKNQFVRIGSRTKQFPVRAAFTAALPAQGNLGSVNSVNHPWFVSIGVNEGTRTANGSFTKNYYGHTDPGDGHNNRGTVSGGRGNNNTPEQVDAAWMGVLENTRREYADYVGRFAVPGTSEFNQIMFNILDLRVQAPAAVPDFVKRIPQIIAEGATPEVIGRLRAESFINPRTGRLEASGFNNDMKRLEADQRRRAGNFKIQGGQ